MKPRAHPRRGRESGVAAIEFAIVLPVLLLLFFGMISLTSYVSMLRKTTSAAELTADLVTRNSEKVKTTDIDDYLTGARQVFLPRPAESIKVEVYNYYDEAGQTKLRWKHPPSDSALCTAPDTSSTEIKSLLPGGDVIIAVVCVPGYLDTAHFPGLPQLGAISKTAALRPRHSKTLLLE